MKRLCESPEEALAKYWGYDSFRGQQSEAIKSVMDGEEGLLVMQTSGGKSLCFQIPGMCKDGTVLVISPLISLMKDQVDALASRDIPATYINSSLTPEDSFTRMEGLQQGRFKFVYVSPERLQNAEFAQLLAEIPLAMVAVDEAHCISTWGHDFRPSYQRIRTFLSDLEEKRGSRVQRFGYTATATPAIREDICTQLGIESPNIICGSFDRKNLSFEVRQTRSKTESTMELLAQHPDESSLIYVSSIRNGQSLAQDLARQGFSTEFYHGKLDTVTKNRIQDDFLNNKTQIVIATSAFGMGVDKPNIRNVIHYHMPSNLENYYQEAGRAGRDGEDCRAYLLYGDRDRGLQEFLIQLSYPPSDHIREVAEVIRRLDTNGEPFNMPARHLSRISRQDIEPRHVNGAIRLLGQHGFLEIEESLSEGDHWCLTWTGDQDSYFEDLDAMIDTVDERRHHVHAKLGQMESFARARHCRRRVLLRYFGDYSIEHDCGNCDICHSKKLSLESPDSRRLPPETLHSALSLVQAAKGRFPPMHLRDALLGVKSASLIRRGAHELPGFGALSDWTRKEVDELFSVLEGEKLIGKPRHTQKNTYVISKAGVEVIADPSSRTIAASDAIRHRAVMSPELAEHLSSITKQASPGSTLKVSLESWRKDKSQELSQPAFQIISQSQMEKIIDLKPKNIESLKALGISEQRCELFGDELVDLISSCSQARNTSTVAMDVGF